MANKIDALYDRMQVAYDRGQIAQSPKNYFPAVYEFIKELVTNPLLKQHQQAIEELSKPDVLYIQELEIELVNKIKMAQVKLEYYKETFPDLGFLLQEYYYLESAIYQINSEKIYLFHIFLDGVVQFIGSYRSNHGLNFLMPKKLDFIQHMIDEIIMPIMHELQRFAELVIRKEKTSLYYSVYFLKKVYWLYDLEIRSHRQLRLLQKKRYCAADHFVADAQDFDKALELLYPQHAASLGFDIEECKMHVYRVWAILKPRLVAEIAQMKRPALKQKKHLSFVQHGSKVIVKYGKAATGFSTNDRTGRFMHTYAKKPYESIEYKVLWAKMEDIPIEELCAKEEKQLEETRKTVNKQLKKIGVNVAFEKTKTRGTDIEISQKKIWLNPKYH